MRISVRTLNGESTTLDLDPKTTITQLRGLVESSLGIPSAEQRFVYAGVQLEETASAAWRARRSSGVGAALGVNDLQDGTPLTLEHHGLQKDSVVNVVRKALAASSIPPHALDETRPRGETIGDFRGYGAATAAAAAAGTECGVSRSCLEAGLKTLSDQDLVMLLRPLLHSRPTVRAALLADDQAVHAPSLPRHPPGVPNQVGTPSAQQQMWVSGACGGGGSWAVNGASTHSGAGQQAHIKRDLGLAAAAACLPDSGSSWCAGQAVHVWSNSAQRWFPGEITRVAESSTDLIPGGSVEVSFELGRKWIAPGDIPRALSLR